MSEPLTGVEVKFVRDDKVLRELKDPTGKELNQVAFEYSKLKDKDNIVVNFKVNAGCKMGAVTEAKKIVKETFYGRKTPVFPVRDNAFWK